MNCPNCSNPKIKYQTKKDPKKSRTDFKAECKKCGWKGEIGSAEIKEIKQENLEKIDHVFCNVKNVKMTPSDVCHECKPINDQAKMMCSNCEKGTPKYKEGD